MASFFILAKNVNTVRTPTEMKQNLLHWNFFVKIFLSPVKLLNISLDE